MGLEARPAVRAAAAQPDAADRRELTYAHNVGAGAESLQLVADVGGRARVQAGVCGEGAVNAALACCCCGDCESGCE